MTSVSPLTNNPANSPLSPEDFDAREPNAAFLPPNQVSSTILIADDNDIVCEFLQETFRTFGYRALVAKTRDEAIEHCQREGSKIQALIVDVTLDSRDGYRTAQNLKAICPNMKVILISGYPYEHLVRAGLLPENLGTGVFLQKPFLPREIITILKPAVRVA